MNKLQILAIVVRGPQPLTHKIFLIDEVNTYIIYGSH